MSGHLQQLVVLYFSTVIYSQGEKVVYFCSLIRLLSKFNGTGISPSRCFTLLEGIGTVNFDEEEDFNIGSVEALIVAV